MKTLLVTGGAGFIGGNFVLGLMREGGYRIVNLDKLTYAGNLDTLSSVRDEPNHIFVHGDIGDKALVAKLLSEHRPIVDRQFRGGVARRSIHRWPGGIRADECRRHVVAARIGAGVLAQRAVAATRRVSISACVDG